MPLSEMVESTRGLIHQVDKDPYIVEVRILPSSDDK